MPIWINMAAAEAMSAEGRCIRPSLYAMAVPINTGASAAQSVLGRAAPIQTDILLCSILFPVIVSNRNRLYMNIETTEIHGKIIKEKINYYVLKVQISNQSNIVLFFLSLFLFFCISLWFIIAPLVDQLRTFREF